MAFGAQGVRASVAGPGPALTRDPDDYVIHLARAHNAEFIVSGDADLLEWDERNPPSSLRLNSRRDWTSSDLLAGPWAAAGPRDDQN
jgi:hypothetical protein